MSKSHDNPPPPAPNRPWPVRLARRLLRWCERLLVAVSVLILLGGIVIGIAWRVWPFPRDRLGRWPASPVVTDAGGRVLLQRIAADGQWRLPVPLEEISPHVVQATIAVEDERYYSHFGVDPLAVLRATGQNVRNLRVVSGASTLTMQVCRMMDDRPRTVGAKVVEAFRALQLSRIRNKHEVLELYLNVAPYGGNVSGIEAASQAYFGKHASELSLAEGALLAGLPQSPARLRPDRHPQAARTRRDFVLGRMVEEGMITPDQYKAARAEPVALAPRDRRPTDEHVVWLALSRRPGGGRTTLQAELQNEAIRLARAHRRHLPAEAKVAVVIVDVAEASLAAMVGSADPDNPLDGQVNGATALRSPGSALKPFVYAAAFEAGVLNPDAIVYDVPIQRAGWEPENFDRTFRGPVPAGEALRRSLNVPAILTAEAVGLDRCLGVLRSAGIPLPADAHQRGGLALAVGGLEVRLLDLVNAYATLARRGVRRPVRLFADEPADAVAVLDANVCAALDDILSSRRRRPHGLEHLAEADVPWFMWKTGTSAGRRDAWAVGHNGRYAVGVWVGSFAGTGRVEFVGREAAEPLLAALFRLPTIRTRAVPAPPGPIRLRHPMPPPASVAGPLRILRPGPSDTFVALQGRTIVHPRANRADLRWFLDGRLLPPDESARLAVPPGTHELRCVSPDGQASAVTFRVR